MSRPNRVLMMEWKELTLCIIEQRSLSRYRTIDKPIICTFIAQKVQRCVFMFQSTYYYFFIIIKHSLITRMFEDVPRVHVRERRQPFFATNHRREEYLLSLLSRLINCSFPRIGRWWCLSYYNSWQMRERGKKKKNDQFFYERDELFNAVRTRSYLFPYIPIQSDAFERNQFIRARMSKNLQYKKITH